MSKKIFELRYIFGLKLKELRQKQGITYQNLSDKSGLSVSYLSEIESGKKYPKKAKILQLAEALGVTYDQLVSLKVPDKIQPIIDLIESDFMRHFPLQEFGLIPQKVIEVVAQDPYKINAFIKTILQLSSAYSLTSSQFFNAALKSYQELHQSYFDDIEQIVDAVHLEFTELADIPFAPKEVEEVLLKIGVRTDRSRLPEEHALKDIRSLYHPEERLLMINDGLTKGQQNFMLGREIAFQWLRLKKRPFSTPKVGAFSFEEALNDYKASYFSAALLMPRSKVMRDVKDFATLDQWQPEKFTLMAGKYEATPEMVMQRLTNLLPTHFGLKNLFFVRIVNNGDRFDIKKEVHLAGDHQVLGNENQLHYCRRWAGVESICRIKNQDNPTLETYAQFSTYHHSSQQYFCLSSAFPNVSNTEEFISVTIGFLVDISVEKKINFLNDPSIPDREVNLTCETCSISNCKERVVDADQLAKDKKRINMEETIASILQQ